MNLLKAIYYTNILPFIIIYLLMSHLGCSSKKVISCSEDEIQLKVEIKNVTGNPKTVTEFVINGSPKFSAFSYYPQLDRLIYNDCLSEIDDTVRYYINVFNSSGKPEITWSFTFPEYLNVRDTIITASLSEGLNNKSELTDTLILIHNFTRDTIQLMARGKEDSISDSIIK